MAYNPFNPYDGPGPVFRFPITQRVYRYVIRETAEDAHNKPGLYEDNWGPVFDPQLIGLQLPPGLEWEVTGIPGDGGGYD